MNILTRLYQHTGWGDCWCCLYCRLTHSQHSAWSLPSL